MNPTQFDLPEMPPAKPESDAVITTLNDGVTVTLEKIVRGTKRGTHSHLRLRAYRSHNYRRLGAEGTLRTQDVIPPAKYSDYLALACREIERIGR